MSNTYSVIAQALVSAGKEGKISSKKALSNALKKASMDVPDYDKMLPNDLGIEPKLFTEKSQEELLIEAKNIVDDSYNEQKEKVNNSYQKKLENLTNKSETKNESYLQKVDKVTEKHNLDTEKAKFGVIKNGLANSSIMGSYLQELSAKYNDEIAKITNDYLTFQQNIDKEILLANDAKNNALKVYDIKMAADIEKKVIALKKEQAIIQQEINKYNRQLLIDKQSYQRDRENTLEELKKAWEDK